MAGTELATPDPSFPSTLSDLKAQVEASGNVLSCPMSVLRDSYGARKLGVHVRANISKALNGIGLGHYPRELPEYQDMWVRVYKLGTPAADLIGAVLHPTTGQDELIREAVSGDAQAILDQVRELVCL